MTKSELAEILTKLNNPKLNINLMVNQSYDNHIQQLDTHFVIKFVGIIDRLKTIHPRILKSTAYNLLIDQRLLDGKCMYCGKIPDFDAYLCITCELRIHPKEVEQKPVKNFYEKDEIPF
jgi:hypothetical protein